MQTRPFGFAEGRGAPSLRLAVALVCLVGAGASAQVRIVSWNTATSGGAPHAGTDTVFDALAAEEVNGIARPVDVYVLQEQSVGHTSSDAIVNLLNSTYGAGTYARAEQSTWNNYGMYSNIVYHTGTMTLVDTAYFRASSSPRDTGRYQLRPTGYGPDADLYIYNTHYKAGTSSTDRLKRANEARVIRWHSTYGADELPAGANVIYAGDFNMRNSYEDATMSTYDGPYDNPYQYMLAEEAPWGSSGNGMGVDPIDRPGFWHDNSAFRDVHTQAPAVSPSGGLTGGGMDDRFDFQLVSANLFDGERMSYIGSGVGDIQATEHSYRAFGNNGTHWLNNNISTGSGASPAVLNALETASDHLPVVADYQLPAILDVSVGAVPSRVILGADLSATVSVRNAAPVAVTIGADELDYAISGTGDVTGFAAGEAEALSAPDVHAISLDTAHAGARGGQVRIDHDGQGIDDVSPFLRDLIWDVLDPAEASFEAGQATETRHVDLGLAWQGAAAPVVDLEIFNLESMPGYTAALEITGAAGVGDVEQLVAGILPATVQAGDSTSFSAWMDTARLGGFATTWSIAVSDENLPGADTGWLTLNLTGAVATMGDYTADGAIDAADIDVLLGAVNGGASDEIYDLTEDGEVDGGDVDHLVREILGTEYGDATLDGSVDAADLSLLAGHWQTPADMGWAEADFTGDGAIDAADLSLLAGNWQWTAPTGATVPEPATVLLLVGGAILPGCRRARRD